MEQHNKKTGEAYGLNGGGGVSGSASTNQMASYGGGSGSRKPSVGSDLSSEDYEEVKPDIKVSSHLLDHGYGFGVTPQYQQQQQQPSHQHHHHRSSGGGGSNSYSSSSQQHSSSYHHHHSPSVTAGGSPAAASSSSHHSSRSKPTTPSRTPGSQQHKSASGDPQITNYFKVGSAFLPRVLLRF